MSLYEQAEKSVDTPAKLRHRLNMSRTVLVEEYRHLFHKDCIVDFTDQRMFSTDGKWALQWENAGKTSIGSVYLVKLHTFL